MMPTGEVGPEAPEIPTATIMVKWRPYGVFPLTRWLENGHH